MGEIWLNEWQLRSEDSPNIIWENGIAYDPTTRRIVFYGGHVGRLYPQSNYAFLYDLHLNRFFHSQPLRRPQRRCLVSVDYLDSCRRVVTCNGGSEHGSLPQGELKGDYKSVVRGDPRGPWLYDAAADDWEDCRTLMPRWQRRTHAPVTYESSSDMLIGLGKADLMLFCPRTNRVLLRPLPEPLKDRLGYGLAADPIHRRLVLFGGSAGGNYLSRKDVPREQAYAEQVKADTWLYDVFTDEWLQVTPKVSPPKGMPLNAFLGLQMVYHDSSGTVLLLQNGIDRYEPDNTQWGPADLWSFDVAAEQWAKVEIKNPPAFAGLMEYCPQEDLVVVFGGGRDGMTDDGSQISPAYSRHVYACRARVVGKRLLPPPQPERIVVETDEDSVRMHWPSAPNTSYDVYRAPADPMPGRYNKITIQPINASQFVDADVQRGHVYAYQICPTTAKGRRSLPGFNQPNRPRGLVASVESAGKVVLHWEANAEQDLVGYLVIRVDGAALEHNKGKLLTPKPVTEAQFVDDKVDLSDEVIRGYLVMAVNRLGVQSGASPLAYTAPDAPYGLAVLEGLAPSNGVGVRLNWLLSWHWPKNVAVAGFNVYHATEHIDTFLHEGGYEAFWKLWAKITPQPVQGNQYIFAIPKDGPPNHYFHVRAVNVLGQEGFYTDIVSPTDLRFRA